MEGDARHAAHVDADRWQDATCPRTARESLVARAALRYRARLEHLTDSLPVARLRGPLRSDLAPAHHQYERRRNAEHRATTTGRRGLLPRVFGRARMPRHYREAVAGRRRGVPTHSVRGW